MKLLKELWAYMWTHKKFWILPLLLVAAIFTVLIVLLQGSAHSPFVYTLF